MTKRDRAIKHLAEAKSLHAAHVRERMTERNNAWAAVAAAQKAFAHADEQHVAAITESNTLFG